MSIRLGNRNRRGTHVPLRTGSASQLRLARGTLAWLLLWKSLVRRRGEATNLGYGPTLPITSYRPRRIYSGNTLTALPVGTVFIVHYPQSQHLKQATALVWMVVAPGRSKLISHNAHTHEDNDFFEQWDVTILAAVPEYALVNK